MRKNSIAKAFLPIMAVFLVQNAMAFVGMEIMLMDKIKNFSGGSYTALMESWMEGVQESSFTVWVSICYTIVCGIWFSVWYYRLRHNKQHISGISDVGEVASDIKKERVFEGYRLTILPGLVMLAVGMQYLCTYLMNFLSTMFPQWLVNYEKLMENIGLDSAENYTVPLIVYTVFLGPIVEELTFRGLTYTYARRATGFLGANLLQAVLFGFLHMNPLQGIYAAVLGFVFGIIYEKSRNIFVTIGLHIIFNLAGTFLSSFMQLGENMISFYFIVLGSLIVTYIGYELTVKSIPQRVEIEEKF